MALSSQIGELVQSFSELMTHHLRLARVELAEDTRYIGLRIGLMAALAPLLLVGYGFLCAALALVLSQVMSVPLALAAVGLLNLCIAVAGIAVAARQLQAKRMLNASALELRLTSAVVLRKEPDA